MAAKSANSRRGRPKKTWNEEDIKLFKTMCQVFCTEQEICSVMGLNDKTLVRLINENLYEDITGKKQAKDCEPVGFADAFDKYSAQGKSSLRRQQFKLANAGDRTMLIWLGKQYLGQSDKVDNVVIDVPVIIDDVE